MEFFILPRVIGLAAGIGAWYFFNRQLLVSSAKTAILVGNFMTNQTLDFGFDFFSVDDQSTRKAQALRHCARALASLPQFQTLTSAKILENKLNAPESIKSAVQGEGSLILPISLSGLARPFMALVRVKNTLDFPAADNVACDILCVFVVPENEPAATGLQRLARVARWLKGKAVQERIRAADNAQVLQALVTAPEGWLLAA